MTVTGSLTWWPPTHPTIMTPASPLCDYVARFLFRSERLGEQVLVKPVTASPSVKLIINLDEPAEAFEYRTGRTRVLPTAFVVGPQTGRRAEVYTRGETATVLVLFRPAGFYRLFHRSVEPLSDTAVDACDVIGPHVCSLCECLTSSRTVEQRVGLLDAFLRNHVADALPCHPAAEAAEAILASHGSLRVAEVIRASGLGARQFERAFRQQIGVSPKLFARAARLDYALQLKRGNPTHTWTRVSQEAGYFDQTHFVKDFKALAGERPSTFPLADRGAELS
jgi:AraC-like DNA-binding protein